MSKPRSCLFPMEKTHPSTLSKNCVTYSATSSSTAFSSATETVFLKRFPPPTRSTNYHSLTITIVRVFLLYHAKKPQKKGGRMRPPNMENISKTRRTCVASPQPLRQPQASQPGLQEQTAGSLPPLLP